MCLISKVENKLDKGKGGSNLGSGLDIDRNYPLHLPSKNQQYQKIKKQKNKNSFSLLQSEKLGIKKKSPKRLIFCSVFFLVPLLLLRVIFLLCHNIPLPPALLLFLIPSLFHFDQMFNTRWKDFPHPPKKNWASNRPLRALSPLEPAA